MYLVSQNENKKSLISIAECRLLILLLLLKGAFALFLIYFSPMGLSPDEAQYWTWSRDLSYGYYSKPPGVAWQIFLTTKLFGNTVFGIRIGAIIFNFLLSITIYYAAKAALFSHKVALWASLIFAFSPFGIFYSFPASTDLGLMLFFMLGFAEMIKKLVQEEPPDFIKVGFWILCAGLFKWTAFTFWLLPLVLAFFYPSIIRWKTLIFGMLVSSLALLPTLIWNFTHDFATFKHVFFTFVASKKTHHADDGGNFIDFLASQTGLLSPGFFVLMAVSVGVALKRKKPIPLFFAFFPALVLFYFIFSFWKKMQPNWALLLYLPGFIVLSWWLDERSKKGKLWFHLSLWSSLGFGILASLIPFLQTRGITIPYSLNPFKQTLGWALFNNALEKSGYNSNQDFIFGDKYQISSLLSFYSPDQKRAYFFNLGHSRKNQFSYWPQMNPKEIGKTGYFVIAENTKNFEEALPWYLSDYPNKLKPYFEKVEIANIIPLFKVNDKVVKFAAIFRCINYNGKQPLTPQKY
jgi:4-amino-4-deoxy-L-arabinose transferase-like glycosyltransferase